MGRTFKPGINITVGSPSVLLANILKEWGHDPKFYDPLMGDCPALERGIYFLGTNDPAWTTFEFPAGSVVIDPWGMSLEGASRCVVKDLTALEKSNADLGDFI